MLRTAADACTPRGSASCADPRGVLLPFLKASRFKELYVLRHERTLQLHESLLPHTASIRATVLRRLIDCGLQLQHVAAGIESCSGDWKRPILRFSFCKGVHILFVKHLSNVTVCVCSYVTGSNSVLSGSHCCSLESTKIQGKSCFGASKAAKFSGLQAQF